MKIYYSPNISWQCIGNYIFIFNEKTHNSFVLEDTSKYFWELICFEHNINDIIKAGLNNYNVSEDVLGTDICKFIDNLIIEGLVVNKE